MKINLSVIQRNKKMLLIAIVPLLIIIIFFIWRNGQEKKKGYQEAAVIKGEIRSTVLSTGIVQPENRLEIKPPIAGRVDDVLVDEGDIIKKGQILVRMSSTERAALLDAARATSADELKKWESYYKAAPIMAPIDGTIILRNVEPGQTVTGNDAILVMSDRLTVKAQVDETDIAEIKLKQSADVVLDAYPDEVVPAHVDRIAYESKTVNNVTTYIADVLPDKTPDAMRSGMTANVSFLIESKADALILPSNAVRVRDGKHFVMVPAENKLGNPVEKEISVGITDGKRIEVVSGLIDGDIVLVDKMKARNGNSQGANPFSPMGTPKKTK